MMYTLGTGRLPRAASRSTEAYRRGACSRVTGRAPLDISAILSEKKYAPPFMTTAMIRAIVMPCRPASAWPPNNSNIVRTVSKNAVFKHVHVGLPRMSRVYVWCM